MQDWNSLDEWTLGNAPDADAYAQVIVAVRDGAPLLADPRLARRLAESVKTCGPIAPGRMWGWLILPDAVRLVVGPTDRDALDRFVERFKQASAACLLDAIRRADDESLDAVLRYSPVWGGALYYVWQAGYHRQILRSEYRLSEALYDLRQLPARLGLIAPGEAWPFVWTGAG